MNIKISEALSKQSLADMQAYNHMVERARKLATEAQSAQDQANGIMGLIQGRVYQELGIQPQTGDVLDFAQMLLIRQDPPEAPKVPEADGGGDKA